MASTGIGKEKGDNPADREPFKVHWLDSAYQQTLLPNAPWHLIEDRISQVLAQRVEKQFLKPERKEALLQILGQDFTDKYLPTAKRNPWVLELPAMRPEEKQKMLREAQAYLNSQMYKAANDVGYEHMTKPNPSGNPPPDYSAFLQHTFNIFKIGLDRELYRQEQELTKQRKHQLNMERKYLQKVPAPSRLKPVSTGYSTASSGTSTKPNSGVMRMEVQRVDGDPPPLWGAQSDEIGKSVLAILQKDPRKFDHVAGRLHGRQLPGSLRAYIWSDVLFKEERKRLKEVMSGETIGRYTHGSLKKPRGLAVLEDGSILVCDHGNSSIHLISQNMKSSRMILQETNECMKPYCMALDSEEKKLYIGSGNECNFINVYSLK